MKQLPIRFTQSETRWGIRFWLFQMIFLGSILSIGLYFLFSDYPAAWLDFAYFVAGFVGVVCIFRRFLAQSLRDFPLRWKQAVAAIAAGIPIYYLLVYTISAITLYLMPEFFNVNDSALSVSMDQSFWLMAVGAVLLAPVTEELLYRGLIFGSLHRRSRLLAYLLSVLLFCGIHVYPHVGSYPLKLLAVCFLQYLPGGLVLAWSYEYSGSIFTSIALHMIINAIGTFAMR